MTKYNIPNDNKCFTIFCTNQRWTGDGGPAIRMNRSADLSMEPFPCMILSSQSQTNEIDDYYLAFTTLLLRFIDSKNSTSILNYLLYSYDNFRWFDRRVMTDVQLVELDNYSNFVIRNSVQPKNYFLSPELIRETTDIVVAHANNNIRRAANIGFTRMETMQGGNNRKRTSRTKTHKNNNKKLKTLKNKHKKGKMHFTSLARNNY
jgi:hypothetical protein